MKKLTLLILLPLLLLSGCARTTKDIRTDILGIFSAFGTAEVADNDNLVTDATEYTDMVGTCHLVYYIKEDSLDYAAYEDNRGVLLHFFLTDSNLGKVTIEEVKLYYGNRDTMVYLDYDNYKHVGLLWKELATVTINRSIETFADEVARLKIADVEWIITQLGYATGRN